MKESPLVSVVIPCFNHGQFLQEALDSIFAQTYNNYEIVIVNDGSTEKLTKDFLIGLKKKKLPNLIIQDQKNQGLSMARNNGIKISKGEFVMPLDSDDFLHKDYLKETVDLAMKNKEIGAVTSYVKCFGKNNYIWETKSSNLLEMLIADFVCGCSLIRKKAFQEVKQSNGFGYNPNMVGGYEDWDFWIGLLEVNKWKIGCIKKPLYYYRVKEESMYSESIKKHVDLYDRILLNHKESHQKYYREIIIEKEKGLGKMKNHIKGIENNYQNLVSINTELSKTNTDFNKSYLELDSFSNDLKLKYSDLTKDTNRPIWLLKRLLKRIFRNK